MTQGMEAMLTDLHEAMFNDFQSLPRTEQIRKVMLAGNAEFVLRMTKNADASTEIGKVTQALREALTRCLPESTTKP